MGASDTVGTGATNPASGSWPALLAARLPRGSAYTNLGVSGSLAREAVGAQLPKAVAASPTVVTIWLAVNDLSAGIDPVIYGTDMRALVDGLLQGTQARIYIGNVPELSALPVYARTDRVALAARIASYNRAIGALTQRSDGRVTIVDLFAGSAELTSGATVASDGFHPSDQGYRLIADRFTSAMQRAGVPLA